MVGFPETDSADADSVDPSCDNLSQSGRHSVALTPFSRGHRHPKSHFHHVEPSESSLHPVITQHTMTNDHRQAVQ